MNTQVCARIGQIKQYVCSLNQHVTANDHYSTLNTLNRFKKTVFKQDPQLHANQFFLDCLKSKNQKLQEQLQKLQLEKKGLEQQLSTNRDTVKNMKQVKVGFFKSRLTVSLNDVKKVEYEEVLITCNYKKILINSEKGSKYKDYVLEVDCIENVQYNHSYVHIKYLAQKQILNILFRFQNEREMQRWVTGLKFAMLIQTSKKKKDKLFQIKRQESPAQVENVKQQDAVSHPISKSGTPHVSTFSFGAGKGIFPSQSRISQIQDKKMQKNMNNKMDNQVERQLVNAMNSQSNRPKSTSRNSQNPPSNTNIRLEVNRPPNLTKIRKLSQNMKKSCSISNIQYQKNQKGNNRKQSEGSWKALVNPCQQYKMLQTLRSEEANESEQQSKNYQNQPTKALRPTQSNIIFPTQQNKPPESTESGQKSCHLKYLQQKKKQLLNQYSQAESVDRLAFRFEINKVNWGGIQEKQDDNKSKSSNLLSSKQRKESFLTQSQANGSKNSSPSRKESEHISEKSEEQSPKQRKSTKIQTSSTIENLQIPSRVKYDAELGSQLHPAQQPNPVRTILKSPDGIPSFGDNFQKQQKQEESRAAFNSLTSRSQSFEHNSDSFSHQDHTQSEDNTMRAQELKKGIILTKYSENGFWPHQKIIYLSQNQNDLCYRDLKDKKIKKIKISNIKSVEYKRYDKGIIKHVAKIEEDRCLVIRAQIEVGKSKNFEFMSAHPEPLERFATNLNLWIQYYKKS